MQVVEHEHERLRRREPLEQRAHRAVAAVALVLERDARPPASAVSEGKTCASSARTSSSSARERLGLEPAHVLVERVDEDGERQVALELGGRAGEDEVPARVGARASSASSRVLPMPGSPTSSIAAGRPRSSSSRTRSSELELLGAPDEMVGLEGHFSSRRG